LLPVVSLAAAVAVADLLSNPTDQQLLARDGNLSWRCDGAAVRGGAAAGAPGPRRLVRLPRRPLPAEAMAPAHPQARPIPTAPGRTGSLPFPPPSSS